MSWSPTAETARARPVKPRARPASPPARLRPPPTRPPRPAPRPGTLPARRPTRARPPRRLTRSASSRTTRNRIRRIPRHERDWMTGAVATIVSVVFLATGSPPADAHVLEGARLFRENQFAEALVEFRMAERLGSPDARGYVAATLVKLARPQDALELFEEPSAPPPGTDPLLDYYHARACYDLRLYLCADGLLAGVGSR